MKKVYIINFILLLTISSSAQSTVTVANYNIKQKRLLIQIASMYLYGSNQGLIDVDSSVVLACKAYKLPVSLSYDEGYNDGKPLFGKDLFDKGNITAVKGLLIKAKDIERLELLVQLGNFYLARPGTKVNDISAALSFIKEASILSAKLKIQKWQNQSLLLLGKYYFQINNFEKSAKYFYELTTNCRKENNKLALAQALENQATFYFPPLASEKEKILQEASSLYGDLGLQEKKIETNLKITTIHFWKGNIKLAKKEYYQSLADMRKIGFKHQQFSETVISYIELNQYNSKSALYYALKSLKTMERTKDYTFADIFYFRLGNTYINLGHYEEALDLYKKSILAGRQNINSGTWYKSFLTAVAALSLKGKTKEAINYLNFVSASYPTSNTFEKMTLNYTKANCYWDLKNYTAADHYFKEMDTYAMQLTAVETTTDVSHAYSSAALFYANRHDSKRAAYFINKIFINSKLNRKSFNSKALQEAQFLTDSLNGNYQSAIGHYQSFKKFTDSITVVSKNKEIEELKIQYETANKEQKIDLLNKQSELQKGALKKSKLLNTVSIWSLALLLITIGLLYNRYRLKQRNNKKLEQKEKEITKANAYLRHLLDEKEWLVREIHHRVKNNLQTVMSLLNSQSIYLKDDMALSAIRNSQHRIHSMSLIHQKLYNTDNISTINMPNYIKELAQYLKDSFSLGQRIRFELKIEEVEMDVSQAVPMGLILNEAITNSIKYAFPEDGTGKIYVTLETTPKDKYLLTISDDGIGFDVDLNAERLGSFGMTLIRGLSEDLESEFLLENNNGTTMKFEFSKDFPLQNFEV